MKRVFLILCLMAAPAVWAANTNIKCADLDGNLVEFSAELSSASELRNLRIWKYKQGEVVRRNTVETAPLHKLGKKMTFGISHTAGAWESYEVALPLTFYAAVWDARNKPQWETSSMVDQVGSLYDVDSHDATRSYLGPIRCANY